ncbi:efflux RND transporter permease subunit [Roseovarius faecimaris]|uniref:Efflux RND transporter permease subunit n=1 Tax=Roseovarius faecimaris TaxID=2494550 RepID=A0A6I6ILK0_9RHOB|nr:efflux RND transporter permease subunit [Roseovarius faecimaris]QGX97172.1 efflux RND transporter permease subunit [Roseovarius faecimaris]
MARALPSSAGGLLSYFTRHRTAANLLLVLMIVLGLAAIPKMRAQFFPDVIVDRVAINILWEGAGAEDVDRAIMQVVEPVLLAVNGVNASISSSNEGRASISLEFEPGWDMSEGLADVEAALDQITTLPEDAEEPEVQRGAWRDRVTDLVITGPVSADQLGLFADELVTRLFNAGVTRTTIRGVAAPETIVEVPSTNLISHDITMREIATAIAEEVDADPAGDISGADTRVRTGVEKREPTELSGIVLRSNPDGSKLTIGDIATVRLEGITRERRYFVGEQPAISIRVDRSEQGDAIRIQRRVQEVADQMEETLPEGVEVRLIRERAEAISGRLNILLDNGLMGLGLVITLLFLFLNVRTAFWVAAGIPVAMLAAIALMYVGGLTINMVSLFALIITLGIVVDDAIVVGEHADARYRKLKESPSEASERAAQRMALPVFSATLTTLIAFFGLTFIGGRFGDLIIDMPFTVIAVLVASLVECFLILPHHMSHALKPRAPAGFSRLRAGLAMFSMMLVTALFSGLFFAGGVLGLTQLGWLADADMLTLQNAAVAAGGGIVLLILSFWFLSPAQRTRAILAMSRHGVDMVSRGVDIGFSRVREGLFRPFIAGVIWARYPVFAGLLLVLASQAALFIKGDVQWRFFNAPERGSVTGNFIMAPSAKRSDTLAMMREMQRATEELGAEYAERYGTNPIDFVIAEIGGNAGRGLSGADNKDPDLLGGISIELIDADLRPYSSFAFVGELQERVRQHPLAETVSFRGWRSGPGGDALDVQFFGASAEDLKAASEALKTALLRFPEVSAVEDNLAYDKEELILELTPQGQALGFSIDALGRVLRARLGGIEAATYPLGPRSAAIRVELPEGELTADFLERMQLRTPAGAYVPLADIVSVDRRTGFSTVRRENGLRLISVTGDIAEDDPARAAAISQALEEEILPTIASEQKVEWRLSGLSEQEDDFLNDARLGLTLTLLGIYLVLAWVFASWTRPVVVMAIIPFGLVGTIYGHYQWDVPLSMFSVVGILGMTGIIINDSIVLVTTIDDYAKDRGLIPSIIDAAADRLRPVLLTTLTTVLGLAPLLFERSQQAQFLKPTVITLVYGLGFGLILVLLMVPALVAMQSDVARMIRALRRGLRFRAGPVRVALGAGLAMVLGWLAATMGQVIFTGALPPALSGLLPLSDPMAAGFVLFSGGAAAISLGLFAVLGLRHWLSRSQPAEQP